MSHARASRPALAAYVRAAAALGLSTALLAGCSSLGQRAHFHALPVPAQVLSTPNAVPHPEPRSARGNPPFYDVNGHRYYVLASAAGYDQRGIASWYGPGFNGAETSMGEKYDMFAMTAAHKTLPLPSYARVTNLGNGRSVVVRINDRGPFVPNRIIDLSYAAAAKLHMLRSGTAFVEVRALTPGAPQQLTRADQSPPPRMFVQAGAFADPDNAHRLLQRLRAAGFSKAFIESPLPGRKQLYRVRVGPVSKVADYDRIADRLEQLGIKSPLLALE